MTSSSRGFVTALLLVLVGILLIGGGIYAYTQNDTTHSLASSSHTPPVTPPTPQAPTEDSLIPSVAQKPQATQMNPCASIVKQPGYILVQGKIQFPKGVTQRDFLTLNNEGIDMNNSFCAKVPSGRVFNLLFTSKSDDNAFILGTTLNSQSDMSNIVIDARSTASAMVVQSLVAVLGSANMAKMKDFVSDVSNDSGVIAFAGGITNSTSLSLDNLDTGGSLRSAYTQAVKSAMATLTAKYLSR